MSVSTKVFVLNKRGQPLMPTTCRKARLLLKENKAKIKAHNPFTIQLQYSTGETRQPITLGIDPGFKNIGFSAIIEKEDLVTGIVKVRQGEKRLVGQRRMFRKLRRARLWYRKSRFDNRVRLKGWLPPSVEHKIQTHKNLIKKLQLILPIAQINVEVSKFDIQKIENSSIKGVEYQQGTLQGYEIKEYLLTKYGHRCVYCKRSNLSLEVEHIIPRSRGGTDRISNLTIACQDCNQKKGNQTAKEFGHSEVQAQTRKSLKAATQMNMVTKHLLEDPELNLTSISAYEIKHRRKQLNLSKSHNNDAFVIAGGATQTRSGSYEVRQTRRNNRKLQQNQRGRGILVRRNRHLIQTNDVVEYRVRNERTSRLFRVSLGGSDTLRIQDIEFDKERYPNVSKVRLVSYGRGLQFDSKFTFI